MKKIHLLTADEPKTPVVQAIVPVVETPVSVLVIENKVEETPVAITPVIAETKTEETPEVIDEISTEPFLITKQEEVELVKEEEKQVTIEFEITNKIVSEVVSVPPVDEIIEQPVAEVKSEEPSAEKIQEEEQRKKAQERILKLKELSFKLKTPSGISDMENEPAYKRRNVDLDSPPHSSESQVSRYTLSEGEDKKIEIKPNNSFLHDNVD